MTDRDDRCSLRSEALDEPLAGTASTIRRWLLIEHAGPWGRDGLLDARLPEGLGVELRALERRAGCRVLLIRRPERAPGSVTCFAVDTSQAWIGSTTLEGIATSPQLDPADRDVFPGTDAGPLAVVCTHGRRDICCAERGRPLAATTASVFPGAVWESTHVGGDRFAGNMVLFPHGLVYGHLEAERGAEVLAAYADGRIVLDRFRGRTSHPMPAQAADHAVRSRYGLDGVDDVQLLMTERERGRARVRLQLPEREAEVHLLRRTLPRIRLTCSATAAEPPVTWDVASIAVSSERSSD